MSDHDHLPIEGIFTDLGAAIRKEVVWTIKDFVPAGLVVLGGPPKEANKSTMALAVACLVSGIETKCFPPFMSQVPELGTVIYFSYEAEAGELRQMAEDGLHIEVPADERILIADDPWRWRLDDLDCVDELLSYLQARQPKLVILDPFRDVHDQDENDSAAVVRVLRPLQQWAKKYDSTVLLIHHTVKGNDELESFEAKHLRGTGAIFGKADAVLMVTPRPGGALLIKATFKRARPWERTLKLATWDNHVAGEPLIDRDKRVLALVKKGMAAAEISAELHHGKSAVQESIAKLRRNGLVK